MNFEKLMYGGMQLSMSANQTQGLPVVIIHSMCASQWVNWTTNTEIREVVVEEKRKMTLGEAQPKTHNELAPTALPHELERVRNRKMDMKLLCCFERMPLNMCVCNIGGT